MQAVLSGRAVDVDVGAGVDHLQLWGLWQSCSTSHVLRFLHQVPVSPLS